MNRTPTTNYTNKLSWIEKFVSLMDDKFRVPGTNFRFGLDPILNLIPVAGDISGFLISTALLFTMAKHGASRKLVILMTLNIVLDFIIGGIPVLGQIFDFFFKANRKNIQLLREHYIEGKHQGNGKGILLLIGVVLLVIFVIFVYIIWKLLEWFAELF